MGHTSQWPNSPSIHCGSGHCLHSPLSLSVHYLHSTCAVYIRLFRLKTWTKNENWNWASCAYILSNFVLKPLHRLTLKVLKTRWASTVPQNVRFRTRNKVRFWMRELIFSNVMRFLVVNSTNQIVRCIFTTKISLTRNYMLPLHWFFLGNSSTNYSWIKLFVKMCSFPDFKILEKILRRLQRCNEE